MDSVSSPYNLSKQEEQMLKQSIFATLKNFFSHLPHIINQLITDIWIPSCNFTTEWLHKV